MMTFAELTFAEIDAERVRLKAELARVDKDEINLVRETNCPCIHCKEMLPLKAWRFIQDHWHTEPHGCTGGDYWNASELKSCYLVCPKCEQWTRIYDHPQRTLLVPGLERVRHREDQIFNLVYDKHGSQLPVSCRAKEAA